MKIRNKPLFEIIANKNSQLYLDKAPSEEYGESIIDLINEIKEIGASEERYVVLINEFHKHGLFREAIRTCCEAISVNPFNWVFHLLKGYNNLFIEQFAESASSLEFTSRLNPESFEARLYVGISYFLLEDYSKSNYAFEQALTLAKTLEDKCDVISWYWIFSLRQGNKVLANNMINSVDLNTENSDDSVSKNICKFYKTNDYNFLQKLKTYAQSNENPYKYLLGWYEIIKGDQTKGHLLLNDCVETNIFSIQSVAARKDLKKTYIRWTPDEFIH